MQNIVFILVSSIITGFLQVSPMLAEVDEPLQYESRLIEEQRLVVFEAFMGG